MTGFQMHHTILVVMQILGISLIFVLFFLAHQRQQARRHEFSKLFVNKLSSEEFIELLQTSAGRRSVERILGNYKPASEWITDAIRRALLLGFTGIGGIIVYAVGDFDGRDFALLFGTLGVTACVGMLVAAALTASRARREDESLR